jgi:hypothetical protein
MIRQLMFGSAALSLLTVVSFTNLAVAQFAAQVVSYDAGATPTAGYTNSVAALGAPEQFTGEGAFPGVVSPFSPPFLTSELASIGEAGHLTLRLSNYVIPQAGGPEIGVFSNIGLIDFDYPNGVAGSPASTFGFDNAVVDVSKDGTNWVSLGAFNFDVPANGYTDLADPFSAVPGSATSDPQLPFTGGLSSFSGLPYFDANGPDMLELLNGSAGGKWLDISATGLTQVGYIRFSVPADLSPLANSNFELDAVSIARGAMGAPTVPEPSTLVTLSAALILWSFRGFARR